MFTNFCLVFLLLLLLSSNELERSPGNGRTSYYLADEVVALAQFKVCTLIQHALSTKDSAFLIEFYHTVCYSSCLFFLFSLFFSVLISNANFCSFAVGQRSPHLFVKDMD